MKIKAFNKIIGLQVALSAGALMLASGANAGLVYPNGMCAHDTNGFESCAADVASLDGDVTYTWNGTYGHLEFSGTPSNMRFRPDQNVTNYYGALDPYDGGLNVIPSGGTETFNFDMYLDASGEFVNGPGSGAGSDGSVQVDGLVYGGFLSTSNSNCGQPGEPSCGLKVAELDGVSLNGQLAFGNVFDAGGAVQGSSIVFDFRYLIDPLSLLSDANGQDDSIGQGSVSNITFSSGCSLANAFGCSWTGEQASANVFVPVPAAAWLFLSAVAGLGLTRRIKK